MLTYLSGARVVVHCPCCLQSKTKESKGTSISGDMFGYQYGCKVGYSMMGKGFSLPTKARVQKYTFSLGEKNGNIAPERFLHEVARDMIMAWLERGTFLEKEDKTNGQMLLCVSRCSLKKHWRRR